MKNEYETPDAEVFLVKLRYSILEVTGGDDDPDIPPMPEGF